MKKENKFLNAIKWWFKSFLWVAPLIFVIDQVTKLLVYYNDTNITVIPNFFTIKLSWNLGAAWSLFEEHPAILAIISVVGTIVSVIPVIAIIGTIISVICCCKFL